MLLWLDGWMDCWLDLLCDDLCGLLLLYWMHGSYIKYNFPLTAAPHTYLVSMRISSSVRSPALSTVHTRRLCCADRHMWNSLPSRLLISSQPPSTCFHARCHPPVSSRYNSSPLS